MELKIGRNQGSLYIRENLLKFLTGDVYLERNLS